MDAFDYPIKNTRVLFKIIHYLFYLAWQDIKGRPWPMLFIVAVFLGVVWYVAIVPALLWAFFLAFLLYRWESRILGVFAILLLISCPILLALNLEPWANAMAVQAFFFLVMTVVLQMIEYKRHPVQDREEEKQGTRKTGSVIDLRPQHKKVP